MASGASVAAFLYPDEGPALLARADSPRPPRLSLSNRRPTASSLASATLPQKIHFLYNDNSHRIYIHRITIQCFIFCYEEITIIILF